MLVLSALVEAFPFNFTPTLKHFAYVGANFTSLRNSLVYAGAAALVCSLFAVLLAYLVQRKEWTGRGVVDFVAIMPGGGARIFFGIGYATTFNQRWLDWLDRGALITISMIFWNIPVGYRAAVAGLQQIDRSIDEAATSLGASSLRVVPRRAASDPARPADDRLRDGLRAGDHDALGGDLSVHAADHGGHDHDLPARQRFQLGRRDRVHGLGDRHGDRWCCSLIVVDQRPAARASGRGGRWLTPHIR